MIVIEYGMLSPTQHFYFKVLPTPKNFGFDPCKFLEYNVGLH